MEAPNAHCKDATPADRKAITPADTYNNAGSDEPGNPGYLPEGTDMTGPIDASIKPGYIRNE